MKKGSRHRWNPGFFALTLLLFALLFPGTIKALTYTVSLDRNKIGLDETATLTMRFEGGGPHSVPDIPALPNLHLQYVGHNAFNSTGSGQVISVLSISFSVTASQMGDFVIPSLPVQIDDQTYQSEPLTLTVTQPAPQTDAFIKLVIKKNEVYIGEVVPVQVEFYYQYAQGVSMPQFKEEGFTMGKFLQSGQSVVMVNDQRYNLIVLSTSVIPVKAGDLNLGPATLQLNIPRSSSQQIAATGFITSWKPATLESEPTKLHVLPLPQNNIPPGFSGAVGSFSFNLTASPTNIAVGDPLTVKIQITGRGALETVTLPTQPGWQKFKLYPPTSDFQPSDQSEISGTKNFSLTAVPESLDIKELPPFFFSYFDPDQKSYKTVTHPPIPLTVRPSTASLPPPIIASGNETENSTINEVVAPIKQRLGSLARINKPLFKQSWFVILQYIPVFACGALFLSRKRAESLASNPRLRRERQVEKTVRSGLIELRQTADANDAAKFFAIVFHLLQEQIGERLDLPASAITEAVLEERLHPLGMPEDQLASLHELFQACNQALYARQSTHEELVSFVQKLEASLADLKKISS